MQYRKFPGMDWRPSALGFGCMRFPTADGNPLSGEIDEEKAVNMVRYAIEQGVNYVDTAYAYHNGNSEIVLGKALQNGYREKIKLATKSPTWLLKQPQDFDKYLTEQLGKLRTDCIDFYLLHGLGRRNWEEVILKLGVLERAEAALKDGRIRHLGFSFHDDYNSFKQIVDGYDKWDLCLLQYNYMDTENQAGTRGIRYAGEQRLGVVVMEPLLGGKLARPPKDIQAIFEGLSKKRSPAEWALHWVWNQPEISLVLSGMSSMEQLQENLEAAEASGIDSLSEEDLDIIEKVRVGFEGKAAIPCTGCNYCLPCPHNVDISTILKLYNDGIIYEAMPASKATYTRFIDALERANNCVQCKLCEEKCPQKISISQWMPRVHQTLGS